MREEEIQIVKTDQQKGKTAPLIPLPKTENISFENDFGETALGLAHFTKDQGFIAVATLVGAFVGTAIAGLPLAAVIVAAGLNDIRYTGKRDKLKPFPSPSDSGEQEARHKAIEVPAEPVPSASNNSSKPPLHCTAASPTPPTTPNPTKWIDNFIHQTALIWGNQGSGKSWMARYIAKRKKDEGYRVVVLDPDSNRAEWEGVESYHDFEEIAEFLRWYVDELKARYKVFNTSSMKEDEWRAKLWTDGKALALICEEVTTYADLIEDKELLTQFFRLGLTKSRKQEMPLTLVSHNNTQSALGGIKGLGNLIEKMLQLELKTDINPETLKPVASGKGAVKLDGSNEWVSVTLPKLEKKITNFSEPQPTEGQKSVMTSQPIETQSKQKAISDETAFNARTQPSTELKVSNSLGEPLKTIWLFAKERESWVTVRDVQRKDFAVLQGKDSEQIRQYLGLLADSGYGEIDEEGKSVRFKAH